MDSTILQVPMSKSLKNSAQLVASEYGFSSLQDLLRVILTKLSKRELTISIQESTHIVSKKNDVRYLEMSKDFTSKKNTKDSSSVDELMHDLRA